MMQDEIVDLLVQTDDKDEVTKLVQDAVELGVYKIMQEIYNHVRETEEAGTAGAHSYSGIVASVYLRHMGILNF